MADTKNEFIVTLPSGSQRKVSDNKDLRSSLKKDFNEIYNGKMKWIHCRGMGTCGTCAMKVTGDVTPPTPIEKWRLNFPPHKNSLQKGIRLLCQCQPLSDLSLEELDGLWGQGE